MKSLAIVSSYSESCGNAAFTKVLVESIHLYSDIQVEVIELDLVLLQSIHDYVRKQADIHITEICEKLKKFDAVNIQLEAGLFGTLPQDITSRVKRIIQANPKTSVTLHSPRLLSSSSSDLRVGIKKIFRLEIISGVKDIIANYMGDIHIKINRKIIGYAVANKCRLIVHTLRAKNQIKSFYGYDQIDTHPLKFISENFVSEKYILESIRQALNLEDSDVLIGMFGYVSSYKGHLDALHAMKLLPANYKLLIFGRQHPQTIKSNGKIDAYLEVLINTVEKQSIKASNKVADPDGDTPLKKRVFFLGELSDEDFIQVAANIDIALLPYYENGQDGSGIASICLDACSRVLCSTSKAFDELFKLIKYQNVMRFDIGNYMEIATKVNMISRKNNLPRPYGDESVYTIQSQALLYAKDLIKADN